jgi:hypothetical protein
MWFSHSCWCVDWWYGRVLNIGGKLFRLPWIWLGHIELITSVFHHSVHLFVLLSHFAFSWGSKLISKKLFKIILSNLYTVIIMDTFGDVTLEVLGYFFFKQLQVVEPSVFFQHGLSRWYLLCVTNSSLTPLDWHSSNFVVSCYGHIEDVPVTFWKCLGIFWKFYM